MINCRKHGFTLTANYNKHLNLFVYNVYWNASYIGVVSHSGNGNGYWHTKAGIYECFETFNAALLDLMTCYFNERR